MKYGVIPSNFMERLALWTGQVPVPLIDVVYSIMKCRCIMAGVRLGLFESLRDGPLTAAQVAARLSLDPEATEMTLRVLVFAEYLEQVEERYELSPLAQRSMIKGAPKPLLAFVEWNYWQWEMVEHLEDLLRTGKGVDFHQTMTDQAGWATYQRAMLEVAHFHTRILSERVPVRPGARHLLDIAGSHGLLGAAVCRKHPPMKSVVIDLAQALEFAYPLAVEEGITDIVEHREGDLTTMTFPPGQDVALLANILHHFDPALNLDILRRTLAALSPDGTTVIWDLEAPNRRRKVSPGDGSALFFRLTSTAGAYSAGSYTEWLRQAGYDRIRVLRPPLAPGYLMVTGRRPAGAPGAS